MENIDLRLAIRYQEMLETKSSLAFKYLYELILRGNQFLERALCGPRAPTAPLGQRGQLRDNSLKIEASRNRSLSGHP